MTATDQSWIEEIISRLPVDIRAEVIIADLIELGLNQDDVVVRPEGLGKRSFSYDVLGAKWIENKSERELLHIKIAREAIYDALPEGLFHQPNSKKPFRTTQEMIDEVRSGKEEEGNARMFFAPYEQEFYRQRITIENQERKTLSQLKENSKSDLFISFWQLNNSFNDRQLSVMLNLLPLTHKIAGDFDYTAQCFENVLETKVQIVETHPITRQLEVSKMNGLGKSSLGVDMVLGNKFNDGDPAVEIIIGPLNNNNVLDFIPGGKNLPVIDIMIDYFIPVETDVKTKIIVDEKSFDFTFNKQVESTRLGFNTAFKKRKLNTNIAS
jgi:hypothetical protein